MSETETPDLASSSAQTAEMNGKTDAKPRKVTTSKAGPVTVTVKEPADEECEDCGEPGKAAAGLGLILCVAAGGLLYIGIDLLTGGGLSRRFGAREAEE